MSEGRGKSTQNIRTLTGVSKSLVMIANLGLKSNTHVSDEVNFFDLWAMESTQAFHTYTHTYKL